MSHDLYTPNFTFSYQHCNYNLSGVVIQLYIIHTYKTKQLQKAGDSELLSRFTEENVIVLESRASGKTLRFRAGEVEGTGGHGALGEDPVTVLARLFVLIIIMGCSLCRCVQVRACSGLYLML